MYIGQKVLIITYPNPTGFDPLFDCDAPTEEECQQETARDNCELIMYEGFSNKCVCGTHGKEEEKMLLCGHDMEFYEWKCVCGYHDKYGNVEEGPLPGD